MQKQKGISILVGIIIIIAVAVVLFGGIYLYYLCSNGGYGTCYPTRPVTLSDETAGWKTYKSEKGGYEIKYPTDLIIEEHPINPNGVLISALNITSAKNSDLPVSWFIQVFKNTENLVAQQLADWSTSIMPSSSPVNYKTISRSNIMLDGVEGVKIVVESSPKNVLPNTFIDNNTAIYIVKGDFVYMLGCANKSTDVTDQTKIKNYDSVRFNQVLSTFKFTK